MGRRGIQSVGHQTSTNGPGGFLVTGNPNVDAFFEQIAVLNEFDNIEEFADDKKLYIARDKGIKGGVFGHVVVYGPSIHIRSFQYLSARTYKFAEEICAGNKEWQMRQYFGRMAVPGGRKRRRWLLAPAEAFYSKGCAGGRWRRWQALPAAAAAAVAAVSDGWVMLDDRSSRARSKEAGEGRDPEN
ncbi:hypothetical protein RHGRI_011880 [Rhododendron griersonianum]|uniref:Uncharacterized protein n=1 Tax=Rhododendron griersonianum TaxID=479676 RepID=A0AAV6KNF5_9ERIC|nr:hypothetical protein RHGRI_011880 [Rhododendron griersonianum]